MNYKTPNWFTFLFVYLLVSAPLFAQNNQMCITVDDLPTVSYGLSTPKFNLKLTQNLIKAFKQYKVPAIGYVNEQKLKTKGKPVASRVALLELWLQNGLELGNHTFSHMDYHRSSFENYTSDILKGEKITKSLVKKYNSNLLYFRHPYLRIGLSVSQADSLNLFLQQHGYTPAPVTIDNDDYIFALAYSRAYEKSDKSQMHQIGKDYIQYMEQKLLYFENQSQKLFHRNIGQTLLIHANLLNSNYLDKLLAMIQSHGYSFVSQTEILKDPAYQEPITKYGNWGISWLDRWALSRGKKGDFFKEDPKTPEYIKSLAQ